MSISVHLQDEVPPLWIKCEECLIECTGFFAGSFADIHHVYLLILVSECLRNRDSPICAVVGNHDDPRERIRLVQERLNGLCDAFRLVKGGNKRDNSSSYDASC